MGQKFWFIKFLDGSDAYAQLIIIKNNIFRNDTAGSFKYNLFATKKDALEARRKIIKILKGE